MGNRRMFSKEIVRSDDFLDLPLSSQALYFQLGMDTDDRGYIANAKSIIRAIGASKGDLELLVHKRFVLIRRETLLLQKHFKVNNYIQKDRFHETQYKEDLAKLYYNENGAYTERETDKKVLQIDCKNDVYKTDTEDKLSKDKLIEVNISQYNNYLPILNKLGSINLVNIDSISSNDLKTYLDYFDSKVDIVGMLQFEVMIDKFIKISVEEHNFDFSKMTEKAKLIYFKSMIDNLVSRSI